MVFDWDSGFAFDCEAMTIVEQLRSGLNWDFFMNLIENKVNFHFVFRPFYVNLTVCICGSMAEPQDLISRGSELEQEDYQV